MKIKLISDRLAEEGLRMEIDIMPPVEFPGCLVSCPSEGDNWMYVNRYPEGNGWCVQLRVSYTQLSFVF